MKITDVETLKNIATEVRKNIIAEVYNASSGHPGGSLSSADILTVLYFYEMNIDNNNVKSNNRDKFVLSKGHCSPALYGVLAEKGFIKKDVLKSFRKVDSILQGHPDMKKVDGVDMSTGSLGQGLSAANGMAIAFKLDNLDNRVYCLLGDGEIEEGQVWEAVMTASHYKLDNLCVIIDNNNLQIDGKVTDVMNVSPIDERLKAFGFEVFNIDGNNITDIIDAFNKAKEVKGKPTAIVAKTIKGKGVSFMEDQAGWHGKAPNEEQYKQAMKDLEGLYNN